MFISSLLRKPRRQPCIWLLGPGGGPNYGDELIMSGWVKAIRKRYPEAEIWIDSLFPTQIHAQLRHIEGLKVTNTIWRLISDAPAGNASSWIRDKIKMLGTPCYDIALDILRHADVLHLMGGGYINNLWPENNLMFHVADAIREFNPDCRLYLTGAGLLPLVEPPEKLKPLLAKFDYAESRDIQGAAMLAIPHGLDDAFIDIMHERKRYLDSKKKTPDVMVCLQEDVISAEEFNATLAAVRPLLESYQEQGKTLGYMEALPRYDRKAFDRLKPLISESNFYCAARVLNEGLPCRAGQYWITTRYHLHLVAASSGAAGVAINAKSGYYDIKHNALLQLGTGWSLHDPLQGAPLPHPKINCDFPEKVSKMAQQKKRQFHSLYKNL